MATPSRQRLLEAALELFAQQGITDTTTKQIAELAAVNEVTLFRQFGNKHGLLLAAIEESAVFETIAQKLVQQVHATSIEQALRDYAETCLNELGKVPSLVRSIVGEAGQSPPENRSAFGRGVAHINHYVAEFFETLMQQGYVRSSLTAEELATLLHELLIGHAAIAFTSDASDQLDRAEFLDRLTRLFLQRSASSIDIVSDLPAPIVHTILQNAKKEGTQDYALAYVLFGAGLRLTELTILNRSHYISDRDQQLLQITIGKFRQVPINQWILGKRYGTYLRNPLSQWLKSRKDNQSSLFLNADEQPLSNAEIEQRWEVWTDGLLTLDEKPPTIAQAQQTWCVELLMRGMQPEDLSLLSGLSPEQLVPYAKRSKEKIAIEQAIRFDQKP